MTNRRTFIKAGLLTAAAGMTASASAVPLSAGKWDEEFDFVVIGAGAAGLVAASHAAEAGLKVLVVEKMASSAVHRCFAAASGLLPGPKCRNPKALKTVPTNSSKT